MIQRTPGYRPFWWTCAVGKSIIFFFYVVVTTFVLRGSFVTWQTLAWKGNRYAVLMSRIVFVGAYTCSSLASIITTSRMTYSVLHKAFSSLPRWLVYFIHLIVIDLRSDDLTVAVDVWQAGWQMLIIWFGLLFPSPFLFPSVNQWLCSLRLFLIETTTHQFRYSRENRLVFSSSARTN